MPRRIQIKSVLWNFLGTYTSRYSDYRGYWLHGQLPFSTSPYEFDLFASPANNDTSVGFAARPATHLFADQVANARLASTLIREATLRIQRQPGLISGLQGWHRSHGYHVVFEAAATMDTGRRFARQLTIFVAPHDPARETQSCRSD